MADRRSSAAFVTCPDCGRYMLGQTGYDKYACGPVIYPQPHQCFKKEGQ